jgi:hypothetical protein
MKHRWYIAIGVVVFILSGIAIWQLIQKKGELAAPSSPTEAASIVGAAASELREEIPGPSEQSPIKETNLVFATATSEMDCENVAAVSERFKEESSGFWKHESEPNTFVAYDSKSRVLTVCAEGKKVAVTVPKLLGPALEDHEELVSVENAELRDRNANGKSEFILFYGQCVEGPCIGENHLLEIDGSSLRGIYEIRAERLQTVQNENSKRSAFVLTSYCFTWEFGIAFSTVDVAEFGADSKLKLLPRGEIIKSYPSAVDSLVYASAADSEAGPVQLAYFKIQSLFEEAYRGASKQQLLSQYDETVNELPVREGMEDPDLRLQVHCSPREMLEAMAK